MPRFLPLLTSATALAVTAALVPFTGASASAAADPSPRPVPGASSAITISDTAASSRSFTRLAGPAGGDTSARAATWPIGGGRTGTMTRSNVESPLGTLPQQITAASLSFYRVYGGVIEGTIDLGGRLVVGDPATHSVIVAYLGNISAGACYSPAGSSISIDNYDNDPAASNPVYNGTRITVRPTKFPAARTASYDCAFVQSKSLTDGSTYDGVEGAATLFRQKPILTISAKGKRLQPRGFTRVPIKVCNSADTVATAPKVRMKARTKKVAIRFNPRIGTIKPGTCKKGPIFVRKTARGVGKVTLIVSSKNYRVKETFTVRPVRRR